MAPSLHLLSFLLLLIHSIGCCYSSSICHDDERSALWQFKESLVVDNFACDPSAKLSSWSLQGDMNNCCSWGGIECNNNTGHVIALDLSSSCLYGSINSSSTIFRLIYLTSLNLADNNFNASTIPSEIRTLSSLTYLNLSLSNFSNQIPIQVLELSKLVSLDLSDNPLKLQNPSLKDLVEKLAHLSQLHLNGVTISSEVPQSLANLSFLSSLLLRDCKLQGEFPVKIFQLPNLRILIVRLNPDLTGYLPEFQVGSSLEALWLEGTNFSGQLPHSIGNLKLLSSFVAGSCRFGGPIPPSIGDLGNLNFLDLSYNNFSGKIPSSFGNLLQLTYLSLSFNNFSPGTLYWLGNLTNLYFLNLAQTNSHGNIPSSVGNMTKLIYLRLYSNKLTGQVPSWLGNLTALLELQLAANELQGPIPESIFELPSLQVLELHSNNLSGTLKFDLFLKSKNLVSLQLSDNHLSLISSPPINITVHRFKTLGLNSCNLSEFPFFLRGENDDLEHLDLSQNEIQGLIPDWITDLGTESLIILNLASNFLTGFERPFNVLPWKNLHVLNLSANNLEGPLPIPPPSISIYIISQNSLTGEISPMFCNLTSVLTLDLSRNNLSGSLPRCLGNFSNFVLVMDLRSNNFSGTIPDRFESECKVRMMDFSHNKLEGKLPRSLANCTKLEMLNLGNNQIYDVFPSWAGLLPQLRVLILRSNRLVGVVGKPETNFDFPQLQIIDLSDNTFTGELPFEYFQKWTAMKSIDQDQLKYIEVDISFQVLDYSWSNHFSYSITITNKGRETTYERILKFFAVINFSSNRFEGRIPEVIGNLREVQLLNLSNNILTGQIPPSLGSMKELEALDLSRNQLSGEIPMKLAQLSFLAFFNVSDNNLTGPVPRGNQFDTFENNSFDANPGLCGNPLSKKCGFSEASTLAPSNFEQDQGSEFPLEFGWKVVLFGYASGLVIGVVIGCILDTEKNEWLVNTFANWQLKVRRTLCEIWRT
ncbi:serine/threonine-protein kinase bri1, putative [Ricinus communis]|uniref:Serine/threonine-protein kinase bri1, putative n=1 Tax=Ricinus communis TaxID=3988 RepID=B9RNT4_RICCO|nr:serine/threonine-protein kinase bri1, putative [Ricinus communis]|eukprot:XP_025012487.1 receptor-like protein 7 [Ricinus communis]